MADTSTNTSLTLKEVQALPETACVGCPNAVWHIALKGRKEHLRVFCRLMHALIDDLLTSCDGVSIYPK